MSTGTIKKVVPDRGFGFARMDDGRDIFFHRSDLEGGVDFDSLTQGQEIEFQVQNTAKGLRAVQVQLPVGSGSSIQGQ